jgi:hypothetical protein
MINQKTLPPSHKVFIFYFALVDFLLPFNGTVALSQFPYLLHPKERKKRDREREALLIAKAQIWGKLAHYFIEIMSGCCCCCCCCCCVVIHFLLETSITIWAAASQSPTNSPNISATLFSPLRKFRRPTDPKTG